MARKLLLLWLSGWLWLTSCRYSEASLKPIELPRAKRLVIVVLDGLSLRDWRSRDMPVLSSLLHRSAIGLLSPDCRRREHIGSIYMTIALGQRVAGDETAGRAFQRNEIINGEPAEGIYRRMWNKPPQGAIVHLGWKHLLQLNSHLGMKELGSALMQYSATPVVIGNQDTLTKRVRYATCIVTDSFGCAPFGIIDGRLLTRSAYQQGQYLTTNLKAFNKAIVNVPDETRFIVVDISEVRRMQVVQDRMRTILLRRMDALLATVLRELHEYGTYVWLITPSPPKPLNDRRLTPVALLGFGVGRGTLTSATTRWHGIISATDLAVTWLHQLNIPAPPSMTGHTIRIVQMPQPLQYITRMEWRTAMRYRHYPHIFIAMGVLCGVAVILFLATIIAFLKRHHAPSWLQYLSQGAALSVMSLPLSLLLTGAMRFSAGWQDALFVFLLAIAMGTIATIVAMPVTSGAAIAVATVIAIAVDTLLHNPLLRHSFIGYTPINGWRFYGIGNEILGALIVSCSLSIAWLSGKPSRSSLFVVTVAWVAVVFITGLPNYGANFGGALALAMMTAGLCFTLVTSVKNMQMHRVIMIAIVMILAGATLVALLTVVEISSMPQQRTHIGEFIIRCWRSGWEAIVATATRKLSLHAEIIGRQRFYILGIATLLVITCGVKYLLWWLAELKLAPMLFRICIVFSIIGLWLVFVFNDTGALAIISGLTTVISYLLALMSQLSGTRIITKRNEVV